MQNKFETIANSYILGNLSTFRKELNKLNKNNLIEFLKFCNEYHEPLNIWTIQQYLN